MRSARAPDRIDPSTFCQPRIDAASRVAIATRSRSEKPVSIASLARRATLSSPSRFLLPETAQSDPRPIRTPLLARGLHARRRAVEQQVAHRRPHHRGLALAEDAKVFVEQPRAVDPRERRGDRPFAARQLQRAKVLSRRLVDAFAQVQQEARSAFSGARGSARGSSRRRRRSGSRLRAGSARRSARRCARCRGSSGGRRHC